MSLKTATVIQAIKSLGKENMRGEVIQKLRDNLSEKELSETLGKETINLYNILETR